MRLLTITSMIFVFIATVIGVHDGLEAETCLRAVGKKRKIRLRTIERSQGCKRGEVSLPAGPEGPKGDAGDQGPQGDMGVAGTNGQNGADGLDGQLRIYGDSSASDKFVASNQTLSDENLQYTDFTVDTGVTLSVPSGTVIRCSGSFVNNGTIRVLSNTAALGGRSRQVEFTTGSFARSQAHPGVSRGAAMNGQVGPASGFVFGASGGTGLSVFQASQLRYPGATAGGGGGIAVYDLFAVAPSGGGSIIVLCENGITNNGLIEADGGNGPGGGGAGGIIILASRTSVVNGASGVLSANGGDGADSSSSAGSSGGGGGGIVHMIAPLVENSGLVGVDGGSAGSSSTTVTDDPRSAGAGGGACGGNGGNGAIVNSGGASSGSTGGGTGYMIVSELDPTALF